MAKANAQYSFSWFMGLGYTEWARSTPWITDQIEANRKAGLLTSDQVRTIWEHHDQIYQDLVDKKNQTSPPKIVEKSAPGQVVGSASAPSSQKDPPWYQKVSEGWGFIFDKSGDALNSVGEKIVGGISIGSYVVMGVIVLFVIKLIRK